MEAGGVRPGPEPFVRFEAVHSSERTRVTRLFLPGRTVIRKEPLGPDADRRALVFCAGGVRGRFLPARRERAVRREFPLGRRCGHWQRW